MDKLAVIIPAYKSDFLERTLQSFANQTKKDFTIYIGDDNSPYDLQSIISKFNYVLNIKYTRFESNIGGKNLVAQWDRCVNLSKDEPWLWLFSDDDTIEKDCVAKILNKIDSTDKDDCLFRLGMNVIDKYDNVTRKVNFPCEITPENLYRGKVLSKLECYAVEFVFSRQTYLKHNGFKYFDLAWGSDLSSWILFSNNRSIVTIGRNMVNWRSSGENISTNYSTEIINRKINALISFMRWGESYYQTWSIRKINDIGFTKRLANFSTLSDTELPINDYIKSYSSNHKRQKLITFLYKIFKMYKNVF